MKLTMAQIKAMNPCTDRFNNFVQHYPDFNGTVQEFVMLENITYADKIWVLTRVMNKEQTIVFTIKCASSVLDIFEQKYPDDPRPRKALEAAETYLANPTEENNAAAASAAASAAANADAAAAAADADAAANAAANAAADAAYAAAYAANTAAAYAYAAAYAANTAAAYAAASAAASAAAAAAYAAASAAASAAANAAAAAAAYDAYAANAAANAAAAAAYAADAASIKQRELNLIFAVETLKG